MGKVTEKTEQRAHAENGEGHDRGRKGAHPASGIVQRPRRLRGLLADFVDGEDYSRPEQGEQVINGAEADQRGEDILRVGRRQVQDDNFKHAGPARHMREHYGDHGQQVRRQEFDEGKSRIRGEQHIQAGPRRNKIGPRHERLRHGDAEGREGELLAENMDRLVNELADHKIAHGRQKKHGPERADVLHRQVQAEFRRNGRGGDHENGPYKSECAHPEGDGQHKHEAHDIKGRKSPCRIKTVAHGAAAQKRAKVVADRLPHKGNERHSCQGQGFMNAPQRQPVIADENDVIDDRQKNGQENVRQGNPRKTHPDVGHTVFADFTVEQPNGPGENTCHKQRPQATERLFQI